MNRELLKVFISIDDTDEIGYKLSTGLICENIKEYIEAHFHSKTEPITRHQLFLHPKIPYTSHNSSMCFVAFLKEKYIEEIKQFVLDYVHKQSSPHSSPGVCIGIEQYIKNFNELVKYGIAAKTRVLTKEEAYNVAKNQDIFLTGIKNGGNGIIGSLAGMALRMYGNDGRLRGKIYLKEDFVLSKDLLKNSIIDEIEEKNGKSVGYDSIIEGKRNIKLIYKNHKFVLLVKKTGDNIYAPLSLEEVRFF